MTDKNGNELSPGHNVLLAGTVASVGASHLTILPDAPMTAGEPVTPIVVGGGQVQRIAAEVSASINRADKSVEAEAGKVFERLKAYAGTIDSDLHILLDRLFKKDSVQKPPAPPVLSKVDAYKSFYSQALAVFNSMTPEEQEEVVGPGEPETTPSGPAAVMNPSSDLHPALQAEIDSAPGGRAQGAAEASAKTTGISSGLATGQEITPDEEGKPPTGAEASKVNPLA